MKTVSLSRLLVGWILPMLVAILMVPELLAQSSPLQMPLVPLQGNLILVHRPVVRYRISSVNAQFRLINTSCQQVVAPHELIVRRPAIPQGANRPLPQAARFLQRSFYLETDAPLIRQLAQQAIQGCPADQLARAKACCEFVKKYITQHVMPCSHNTALFVARHRLGDCKNHATLLAALLRANKIPARGVVGMVLVPRYRQWRSVMMFHMWTQAYIRNTWYPLDPSMPPGQGVGPTHIALAYHDFNSMVPLTILKVMSTLAGLQITVLP